MRHAFFLVLFASFWGQALRAQDSAAVAAALALAEEFDVPASAFEDATEYLAPFCEDSGSTFNCTARYETASEVLCRGMAVAFIAGTSFEMVGRHMRISVSCTSHRVEVDFVPEVRTAVVEYDSRDRVVYQKAISR